jgi:predicted PurR-regulated permease PerM
MSDALLKKIRRILLWLLGIILLIWLIFLFSDILVLLIIAVLLAFIFEPLVRRLEKEGFNRLNSTLIIFISVGFLLYIGFSLFIPLFTSQMNQLMNTLQVYSLHDQLLRIEKDIHKYLPFFTPGTLAKKIEDFITSSIINSIDKLSEVLTSIVSVAAILIIVPFITFFLLKDRRLIMKGLLYTVPNKYFEMSYWILKKVSIQLGRFVRGWIFDATFVGTTLGLGFLSIGVENALILGVVSGLGHLVPYFGPVIGGIPAIIISIIQYGDLSRVPLIILLIVIVYTLDNGFVQPFVFSKSVDMHPIIIILLILAGSQLFGVLGMLLAVPTASVFRTAMKEIYFALKNYRIAKL